MADHHSACVGTWYPEEQGPAMRAWFGAVWPVKVPEPREVEPPPQRLPSCVDNQSYGAVPLVMKRVSDAAVSAASGQATVAAEVTSSLRPHWKNAPR